MNSADCDFCNLASTARWLYVLPENGPIIAIDRGEGLLEVIHDDGLWHACIGCAALVDRADVTGLVDRAERHMASAFPDLFEGASGPLQRAMLAARFSAVMMPGVEKHRV